MYQFLIIAYHGQLLISTCTFSTRENNLLDLQLTSDPNMVNKLECVGKLGSSDHVLILAELNFKTIVTENSQEITDWEKQIWTELKNV